MKSWKEFMTEEPGLGKIGKNMLFQSGGCIGSAFLATLRKDGAPRLHPVSLVYWNDHLYVFIPPGSPKCADLKRDGRYALQAFPPYNNIEGEEFYLSGITKCIQNPSVRHSMVGETGIRVEEGEVLFELLLERAMYTKLVDRDTSDEHPWHRVWHATRR